MSKKKTNVAIKDETAESMVDSLGPELCLALAMCADSKPPSDELLDGLHGRGLVEGGTLVLTEWGNAVLNAIEARYCTMEEDEETLQCILTIAESIDRGKKLAAAYHEKRRHENELQVYKENKKSEIVRLDALITQMSRIVENGFELRNVQTQVVIDRLQNQCIKTRMDTGEVFDCRPLDQFERQMTIPNMAPNN